MTYAPQAKLYYCKNNEAPSNSNRLVPAPTISVAPEYYLANNIVIGYTYNATLNGYATSIDRRVTPSGEQDIVDVIEAMRVVKNILNGNGGTLLVRDDQDEDLLRLTGGTIRTFNFSDSDNLWVNYAPYSCTIEFNEIQLGDCDGSGIFIDCNVVPSGVEVAESPDLVDMKEYKIKSFNDSWNFELSDQIYSSYEFSEGSGIFHNEYITATYTIDATGKHYFVDDQLIPAWEQAKNFVQKRLYDKVAALPDQILRRQNTDTPCTAETTLNSVFGTGSDYLLDGLTASNFGIYNETISCDTNEGEGTFSATYTCLIKRTITGDTFSHEDTLHTISLARNVTSEANAGQNIVVSVEGTIQGLLPAGLTNSGQPFELPQNGQFLISDDPTISKYDKALAGYDKIGVEQQLNDDFASLLGITYSILGVAGDCYSEGEVPYNSSHNVTHNYKEGTITYRSEYNTANACRKNKSYSNISITVEDKIPVIAEFIVPGRSGGPVVQRIGVDRPKKISLSIDGVLPIEDCCFDFDTLVESGCASDPTIPDLPEFDTTGLKLTEDRITTSPDGSYSINKTYICCDE